MKVIFIKTVANVGSAGEVKEVSEGFARNFLLPKKIAEPATEAALKQAKLKVSVKEHQQAKIVKDSVKLAEIISKLTLTFKGKADQSGTLFAGISAEKIAENLQARKYSIKAKQIELSAPLKKIGTHSVAVDLGDKKVTMKVVLGRS